MKSSLKNPGLAKNILIYCLLILMGGVIGFKIRGNEHIPGLSSVINTTQKMRGAKVVNTDIPAKYQDNVDFQQFWEVWQTLEEQYLDEDKLDKQQMVFGAISGMTSSLQDPYTLYLPPQEQKRAEEDLSGAFFGVGIQLGYVDNVLAVTTPLKGSPAERAGVKAKDLILRVKDEKKGIDKDTQDWSLQEAVDTIRGERGTSVTLTLLRKDEKPEPFQVTLTRDEIVVPTTEVAYVEKNGKKIAHITLNRFGERTNAELDTVIRSIQSQSPKVDGIVLDMRNNPGGFLDGAITVSGEFIKDGVVVTQKGKYTSKDYTAKGQARLANYPVVVVVNGGSASAAEIVAGALRDRKNAKLVGEKTFGKGTVQDALRFDNGAGLHVTIARWLLPKGDWIHDTGIPVTVEIKDDETTENDEILDKAVEEVLK